MVSLCHPGWCPTYIISASISTCYSLMHSGPIPLQGDRSTADTSQYQGQTAMRCLNLVLRPWTQLVPRWQWAVHTGSSPWLCVGSTPKTCLVTCTHAVHSVLKLWKWDGIMDSLVQCVSNRFNPKAVVYFWTSCNVILLMSRPREENPLL